MRNSRPGQYIGTGTIAAWFDVEVRTVNQWTGRYGDFPAADVKIDDRTSGWLPSREAEIREWHASRPGQGAGGGRPKKEQKR